jgi:hypothetical protein
MKLKGIIPSFTAILVITLLIATIQVNYGQTIQITEGANTTDILENDYALFTVSNTVATIHASKIKTETKDFTQLHIAGYGFSTKVGEPKLPVLKKLIEIPLNADVEVFITHKSFKEFSLDDFNLHDHIIPVQPSLSKSEDPLQAEFQFREDVYNFNGFLGDELVSVEIQGTMRGIRMARMEIAPVQYNPVTNMIRVYSEIQVEFRFTGGNIGQTIAMKENGMNPFFTGMSKMLFNYKQPENTDNLFDNNPITYIIVSDPMFEEVLQPFIAWKTRKGFMVVEAYTDDPEVGNTPTSIKNFLEGFYNDPPEGYHPQSFILIVGDVAQVPAFDGTSGNHATDLYYAEYTGDKLPEAFYGRFSANNIAQLQPQIDKTLEYEQYLFPDPSFLDEVVMVAGKDATHQMEWGNGQVNYGTEYYFNEGNGLYSHTYLQPEPAGGNYAMQIRQTISDGVAYANYTAHCSASGWADPAFTTNHIQSLQNQSKYPLMVGNCCSSASFQSNSFGEDIMRADGKGAVGYIGGSNNTYWDEDFWWAVGFKAVTANPVYDSAAIGTYDRLFHNQPGVTTNDWHITQGQMPTAGNLAVAQSGTSLTNYYWEIYHLMGDPSLMAYFSQPPDINANYNMLIPLDAEAFTVNTVPFAYVSISKDGVLHGAAFANSDGLAHITFTQPFETPGEAGIVITGQNLKPYSEIILVASPDGPFVLCQQALVNDQSAGNGNGLMDYAETISLDISMQNFGQQAGENITLVLTCHSEFVTITDSLATLEIIEPNELMALTGVFEFLISETLPDGHLVHFEIEATDGTQIWTSNFSLTGHAPVIEFAGYMIDDEDGNNNGKLDPGETVQMTVYAKNTGTSPAFGLLGELSSPDLFITISSGQPQLFGDIGPDEMVSTAFEVSADAETPHGHLSNFDLGLFADMSITGYGQFEIIIGPVPLLIIDLDGNPNSADLIHETAMQLGVVSELANSIPDELFQYSSIFVCLGVYSQNHKLTNEEGQLLADYLNAGGMLYIEGGDTWYYDPATPVHEMFGINGTDDGSDDLSIIDGNPDSFTGGISFAYVGDNSWIDHLEPLNGAEVIFTNQSPEYHCAISKIGSGYKTIGASFEFGGIETAGDRLDVLQRYLEFFSITLPGTMACNLWAAPDDICQGDTTQLILDISGGSGSFSYQWTPADGLNDPAVASPVASPDITTNYAVEIIDLLTGDVLSEEITINVREKPATPEVNQVNLSLVSDAPTGNQWYSDDGMIEGATGQIYYPKATSNYYTIVTNALGCSSDSSNVIYFQSTYIDELVAQGSLRVYPNPTNGLINIDFITENAEPPAIQVFNAFGQLLTTKLEESLKRTGSYTITYDMSSLPGGVYYFKFTDMNRVINKKIILSK